MSEKEKHNCFVALVAEQHVSVFERFLTQPVFELYIIKY